MATIYIVEDDVNIREIERYALKNSGYQVEEFECGADLFKRLESKVPALILLDIMLPNEDGLDILTKIRADKNTAKVPIIMVTAKTSELDKVKGLDLGADDYISKPFGVMELISRVKALLRRTPTEIFWWITINTPFTWMETCVSSPTKNLNFSNTLSSTRESCCRGIRS